MQIIKIVILISFANVTVWSASCAEVSKDRSGAVISAATNADDRVSDGAEAGLTTSLNRPIGETDSNDLGDLIEDSRLRRPTNVAAQETLKDTLSKVLTTLTYREREILNLWYGLGDGFRIRWSKST